MLKIFLCVKRNDKEKAQKMKKIVSLIPLKNIYLVHFYVFEGQRSFKNYSKKKGKINIAIKEPNKITLSILLNEIGFSNREKNITQELWKKKILIIGRNWESVRAKNKSWPL